jgi:hypothetical protein
MIWRCGLSETWAKKFKNILSLLDLKPGQIVLEIGTELASLPSPPPGTALK